MQDKAKSPTLLYFFEHVFLRDALFGSPEFLTGLKENPDNFSKGLIANFNRIKENPDNGLLEKDVTLKDGDFKAEIVDLDSGEKVVVIKCPIPRKPPEAGFIGIVMGDIPRYFVSEYETHDAVKQVYPDKEWKDEYILCEWENTKHKNYGKISDNKEGFVEGISKILSPQT